MPIELYMSTEFDTSYERDALKVVVSDLYALFGDTTNLCIILANYFIQGRQVDITILKKDAIIVVELKNCCLPFTATENGSWECPDGHTVGHTDNNPYQQVRGYRIKWKEFLTEQKSKFDCLRTVLGERALWQVIAMVAISPSLHPEVENHIPDNCWWFKLVGSDALSAFVPSQTNKHFNFSDDELRSIPALLDINAFDIKPFFYVSVSELLRENKQLQSQVEPASELIREQKREVDNLHIEIRRLVTELDKHNTDVTHFQEQIDNQTNITTKLEAELEKYKQNLQRSLANLAALEQKIKQLDIEILQLQSCITSEKQKTVALKQAIYSQNNINTTKLSLLEKQLAQRNAELLFLQDQSKKYVLQMTLMKKALSSREAKIIELTTTTNKSISDYTQESDKRLMEYSSEIARLQNIVEQQEVERKSLQNQTDELSRSAHHRSVISTIWKIFLFFCCFIVGFIVGIVVLSSYRGLVFQ